LVPSLIYTNAGAAATFLVACLIWNIPEAVGMVKQRAPIARTEATVQDRGSMGLLISLQWLGLTLCLAFGWIIQAAAISWQRVAIFRLGVILILLGVALRWYAIWTLGRYFTRDVAVSANQQVVRRGPYHVVRHPAYSGTILTMLGVGLAMTNWASLLVLCPCVLLGHLYRVRVEERALIQTIGQPYVEYMRHTKRFIPWVV
jgi:protein-S-isoprenylcysteine O-methyltransferase Ste14